MTLLAIIDKFAVEYLEKLIKYEEGRKQKNEESELEDWLYGNGWKKELIESLSSLEFNCGRANRLLDEVVRGEISLGREVVAIHAYLSHEGLVGVSSGVLHSVFEVGVSWDYILDLPFIPGSSVKGAVRSLTLDLCARLRNSRVKCECFKLTTQLFGWVEEPLESPEARELEELGFSRECMKGSWGMGLIVFHDAYPVPEHSREKCMLLEPWVMTPHYTGDAVDEYSVQPVPIPHVVLRKDTVFKFIVSYDSIAKDLLERLAGVLRELGVKIEDPSALLSHLVVAALESGVGARTSKGYSTFKAKTVVRYRGG